MKLAVIDKDGTLTTSVSGAKFPQSPTDQKLLPGVKEAIDRLRADGWTLAIASNQGGCDWFDFPGVELKTWDLFRGRHEDDHLYGKIYKVVGIEKTENGIEVDALFTETRWHVDGWVKADIGIDFRFAENDRVLIQHKTISSAFKEVTFAADLCGIYQAYFCPSMAGNSIVSCGLIDGSWRDLSQSLSDVEFLRRSDEPEIFNFRKPSPGMLQYAESICSEKITDRIMIGDRPEDKEAAGAAGFRFLDATEWRNGASA